DTDEAVRLGWIEDTDIQRDLWTNRLREFRATADEIRRPDTDLDRNATQAAKERLDDIRFGRTRL
ncbi:MAG: hypothetical protein WA030_03430, partial [Candidatus Microsaccharimonas sp.]